MNEDISIDYKIQKLGFVVQGNISRLTLDELEYYSYEGLLSMSVGQDQVILREIPLLNTFSSILGLLRVVPIWKEKAEFQHYFRAATTGVIIEDQSLLIYHKDINAFAYHCNPQQVVTNLPDFCRKFGDVARRFVADIETRTPSLSMFFLSRPELHSRFPLFYLSRL